MLTDEEWTAFFAANKAWVTELPPKMQEHIAMFAAGIAYAQKQAAAELERLGAERDNFYMEYRMQRDVEAKRLCVENERLTAENAALKDHNGTIVKLGAENDRLWKENAALRAFIQESADELCSYGDNCPPFIKSNHGRCDPCKARAALDSARAKESGDGSQ